MAMEEGEGTDWRARYRTEQSRRQHGVLLKFRFDEQVQPCVVRPQVSIWYVQAIDKDYGLLSPEQFSKYANLFFLFTAFIQQIPGVSPTNRYTTIAPLAVVLMASAFKEVQEDLVRHPFLKTPFTY